MNQYSINIKNRNQIKYWLGYFVRLKTYLFQSYLQYFARKKGAIIGLNCYLHPELLKKANSNLSVGSDTVIGSDKFDLRGKIEIGSNVIVNGDVHIITASHDYNSTYYETIYNVVKVEDYAWVATGATLLPGVKIGFGAVVGAESVVRGSVESMAIVAGNPAIFIKKRSYVHSDLITCSLQGMDFRYYVRARKN